MSGELLGQGESLTYQTTADFKFNYAANSDFMLGLESEGSLGAGFDSAMLEVFVDSVLAYQKSLTSLADAQAFFTDNPIDLGSQPGGPEDVELVFDMTGSQTARLAQSTQRCAAKECPLVRVAVERGAGARESAHGHSRRKIKN